MNSLGKNQHLSLLFGLQLAAAQEGKAENHFVWFPYAIILLAVIIAMANLIRLPAASAAGPTKTEFVPVTQLATEPLTSFSCQDPPPQIEADCRRLEEKILASTVRLFMVSPVMHVEGSGWRVLHGNGHATVKEGRYLVTHNHFEKALIDLFINGDPEGFLTVFVLDTQGEVVLQRPAAAVSIARMDPETLVFDFGEVNGEGLFSAAGLPSTQFATSRSVDLNPGMEVAQIDWNGSTTHILWTTIEAISITDQVPAVRVSGCLRIGASGGGLFWQGIHIGNNWRRSAACSQFSKSDGPAYSVVALNSAGIGESN